MQDRKKIDFLKICQKEGLKLTCFKTVTLRLFGFFFFFSRPPFVFFAPKRANLGPEIVLFAKAGKPNCCAWLKKLTHIIKIQCFSTYFALSDPHVI